MDTATADQVPVIGHDWAIELLKKSLVSERLGHAYLFVGPPCVGKTTLALYLAQAVNCLHPNVAARPCGECASCRRIKTGRHTDVRVLDDLGAAIKIDEIRDIQRESSLAPYEGRRRVYVLCNMERAGHEASNCLLKTLEEPPSRVMLVLTASAGEALLPTIVSRCQVLYLRPIAPGDVQAALRQYWAVEDYQAQLLARLSEGSLGWAVRAALDDTVMSERDKYLIALEGVLNQDRVERMNLASRLSQNAEALPQVLAWWQSWWRDLLLAKSENGGAITNLDREQTVLHEAQNYTCADIVKCLRDIQQTMIQLEQNVNPRLALEVLLLKMPRSSLAQN